MLKKKILIIGAILMTAIAANAKDSTFTFRPGSEIRISVGVLPASWINDDLRSSFFRFGGNYIDSDPYYGYYSVNLSGVTYYTPLSTAFSTGFSDTYKGPSYIFGAYNIEYKQRLTKHFQLSAMVTYSGGLTRYYSSFTDEVSFTNYFNTFSVMPVAKFIWFYTKYVRMYSSVGFGVQFQTTKQSGSVSDFQMRIYPSVHFNPVGIEVGNKVYGFLEFPTIGMTGLVIAGIGVKIN